MRFCLCSLSPGTWRTNWLVVLDATTIYWIIVSALYAHQRSHWKNMWICKEKALPTATHSHATGMGCALCNIIMIVSAAYEGKMHFSKIQMNTNVTSHDIWSLCLCKFLIFMRASSVYGNFAMTTHTHTCIQSASAFGVCICTIAILHTRSACVRWASRYETTLRWN